MIQLSCLWDAVGACVGRSQGTPSVLFMLHTQYLEIEARPVCWTRVGSSLTHAVTGQGDQFDLTYDCPVQQCCFSLNLRIQVS